MTYERAIEYQVPELKTIWDQFPNILWIKGLGGYVRLGNQNICRITLRKKSGKIDSWWNNSLFYNDEGEYEHGISDKKYAAYIEAFECYYIGYNFRVISLITGEKISSFYHTWDEKLFCESLEWSSPPTIEDMLKAVAMWYGWIEVWCK